MAEEELSTQLAWYVAHTRPRREKKLAEYCEQKGFSVNLPLYRSVKKYEGKTVEFTKPLFPGYVFLRLRTYERAAVFQSDYVANILDVVDQELFEEQLGEILRALECEIEVFAAPYITKGKRVRIKSGPLRGIEGLVEDRTGKVNVVLRLDFISQAAAIKMEATELELID